MKETCHLNQFSFPQISFWSLKVDFHFHCYTHTHTYPSKRKAYWMWRRKLSFVAVGTCWKGKEKKCVPWCQLEEKNRCQASIFLLFAFIWADKIYEFSFSPHGNHENSFWIPRKLLCKMIFWGENSFFFKVARGM